MLHELWDDPASDGRFTFCYAGDRGEQARALLSPRARLVWTVEASSYFEAMTLYFEHQGWGVYTTDQGWDYTTYADNGWEVDGRPVPESLLPQSLTDELRRSSDPLYTRLRNQLTERGVDVGTAVLAQLFPDDVDQEFGVVVDADRRVYTFVLYYGRGDIGAQVTSAKIHELSDITSTWRTSPFRQDVERALALPRLFGDSE